MRKQSDCTCAKCKKVFKKDDSEIKRNLERDRNNFCSRSCSSNFNRPKIEKEHNCNCSFCGITFYRNSSKLKASKHGMYFCSRKCKDTALRFENGFTLLHPDHYKDGLSEYRTLAFRVKEKKCERCGYEEYPEIIQIHHKNRDRKNNNIENLEALCPNCHEIEHIGDRGLSKENRTSKINL